MAIPKRCPRCGARDLREITYGGSEDARLLDLWAHGDLMLRQRRAGDGKSPGWMCAECGFERPISAPEA